jgi:7,8-dihydropterin-6-yl-methyl-4-(beta-D-ribofuranosyl)aminobenzene 5'-phosphate synthase
VVPNKIEIVVLIENTTSSTGLAAEHGLSLWIDTGDAKVLFDTGASGAFADNAEQLGVDLSEADAIVLSHGHPDHSGGLERALDASPNATVYAHPAAEIDPGQHRAVFSKDSVEIVPGIRTTGQVPRELAFEESGGSPIPNPDDQSIFFEAAEGLVLLTGCAHSGLVNTAQHVIRLTGNDNIYAVIGGTHLGNVSEERLEQTAAFLRDAQVRHIGLCHCTGERGMAHLKQTLPEAFVQYQTGTRLSFDAS